MVPIFISSAVGPAVIGRLLLTKFAIALITGITVDMVIRLVHYTFRTHKHIHDLCEQDECGCEDEEGGLAEDVMVRARFDLVKETRYGRVYITILTPKTEEEAV
jgi:hypothetical protein